MPPSEEILPPAAPGPVYTGLRKNRFSLKWKTTPPVIADDAPAGPANVVSFLDDGTACVVLFPYTPELTESEWKAIDAAHRVRFFVYACSDGEVAWR